ncbi:MAG TPA: glycosyltransferase family 4 protein [Cyclobacteriaceae bacterium]|nr:glycosyltransferase family 4 protein [Cyclobacteriaceae bacterium]
MKKIKIGFVVSQVANTLGFENVVSGHVQLPLHTMKLLKEDGNEVQLLTTEFNEGQTLPRFLPSGVKVHQITHGYRSVRGENNQGGPTPGLHVLKILKQLQQIKGIVRKEGFDILHFFGGYRLAYLAASIRFIGIKIPKVFTISIDPFPDPRWPASRFFWKQFRAILTTTEYMATKGRSKGLPVSVIKHGVVRDIQAELEGQVVSPPHRVLFWRDPSLGNGADVCLKVYQALAPRYPDVSFDFAVRPYWKPVTGLMEIVNEYPNVHVFQFPYSNGMSLSKLLAESICVLLPFRGLSVNPQFSVLESMQAGCAVITTGIDSNVELIQSGENGFLVSPGDSQEIIKIVEKLLANRQDAIEIGRRAAKDIGAQWNWNNYLRDLKEQYELTLSS